MIPQPIEPLHLKLFLFAALTAVLNCSFVLDVEAESELQLRIGTTRSNPKISSSTSTGSDYATSGGVTLGIEVAPRTFLETGVIVRGHSYAYSSTQSIKYMDVLIPVLGRLRPLPWLDLGVGFYYAQNPDSYRLDQGNGNIITTRFDSVGLEGADWGARLNPRVYMGKNQGTFIDLSYDYGIKDLDRGGGASWKNRVWTLSFGFVVGLGGTPPESYEDGPVDIESRPSATPKPTPKPKLENSSKDEVMPL